MATKRVAINGFGRIGRHLYRHLSTMKGIKVVAVNDLAPLNTLTHLLKYDTAQGLFDKKITIVKDGFKVGTSKVLAFSQRNPEDLPWEKLNIDIVVECTGFFRTKELASLHIKAGAKKVLLSAPAKGSNVKTVVIGVNEKSIKASDKIISNASCTTNCLAPVTKVIVDNWGITSGSFVTVHSYTADQRIQDAPHGDLRRARAAAQNIIPTSTGAAIATGLVIPEVKGKITAMSYRVPTITGSIIELNVTLKKKTTLEEVLEAYKKAATSGPMKGILQYNEDPIVSSDIIGSNYSSIFDAPLVEVKGKQLRVISWYDNEAGYSSRLAQLVGLVKV